ncbi:MAG: amidohydrolase family protein [Deltaproteobacteria bacterium]|nr:amidohydrolase family protein [Deltaproteobacteria bacterium]
MNRVWVLGLIVAACLPPPPVEKVAPSRGKRGATSSSVEKRIVVNQSRTAGYFETSTRSDGSIAAVYHVLENGRGPHVEAEIRLADDWTISSFRATGKHTMGTKVDETFSVTGTRAAWKSNEERGDQELEAPAFFIPMASMPIEVLLVPAALKAGGKLAVLPGGEATVAQAATTNVTVNGETRALVGYSISGLGLDVQYTWFDREGDWFGTASEWSSVVPEGWEGAIEPLIQKQRELSRARDAKLATQHATRPVSGFAFTDARVLDVEKGVWIPNQTVIVQGDKIMAVGPTSRIKIPEGTDVLSIAGQGLIPGLIDMHAHTSTADGILNLASGVTTIRDVGNDPDLLDDLKKRYDDGTAIGPNVVRMGFIEGRGEKAASSKVTATTPDEAKAAVEIYAKRGYDGVKIYNSVPVEIVPVIIAEAHARKMLVTGHIPVHMLAAEAVKAGYDSIEHINMLFLNFLATHETDTRDTTRFTLVGDKASELALDGKPVQEFFDLLRTNKVVIDPTLAAFEDLFVGVPGKINPGMEDTVARLPLQVRRWFLVGGLPMDAAKQATYAKAWDQILAMVKALWTAKIPLVLGTDHIAGLMLHHEMELFVRAGIPAKDVLRMATMDAARALRLDKKIGSIAIGKRADLVIVDGDPLEDIKKMRNTVFTMRAGVLYKCDALYGATGVKP